jgi:hypothetical protein
MWSISRIAQGGRTITSRWSRPVREDVASFYGTPIWLVQRHSSGRPKNLIDLTPDLVDSLLNQVSVARVKGRGLS